MASDILLESGTNEVEIIEFFIGDQSFGINVQKLREIVFYDPKQLSEPPGQHVSLKGSFMIRGSITPLIDLGKHLGKRVCTNDESIDEERKVVLVCEFNEVVNSFLVDGVNQIHRVSWEDVKPIPEFIATFKPRFTGSMHIEGREILIVDMEHIIGEIFPHTYLDFESEDNGISVVEARNNSTIWLAEDSAMIRMGITDVLKKAGYLDIQAFADGAACLEAMTRLKEKCTKAGEDVTDQVKLLISDIEMPEMDGLSLCKTIKSDEKLKNVAVIMFSSLITEENSHKCEEVGADGHISKPQIAELVDLVDSFCLTIDL